MKELSIEEKARRYDELLVKLQEAKADNSICDERYCCVIDDIVPELKENDESKDERIRKTLISYFAAVKSEEIWDDDISFGDILAWLEKQGETFTKKDVDDAWLKGMCDAKHELEKQGEQKPADKVEPKDYNSIDPHFGKPVDKVEPKFKVGEWITDGQLTCKVLSVTGKSYELHLYNDDYCHFETDVQSVDKHYHLWTIQDTHDGDVLTSIGFHSNCTFILKGLDNWKSDEPNGDRAVATGYCCLSVSSDKMEFGIQGPDCVEVNTVKPASKIQRELLFKKMKEAGYEWDADKLELRKIEQKPAWSKEDNTYYDDICEILINLIHSETAKVNKDVVQRDLDWLISIKNRVIPQPKQEWCDKHGCD